MSISFFSFSNPILYLYRFIKLRYCLLLLFLAVLLTFITLWRVVPVPTVSLDHHNVAKVNFDSPSSLHSLTVEDNNTTVEAIRAVSAYFQTYPLHETKKFGELGNRLRILRQWINLTGDPLRPGRSDKDTDALSDEIEKYALSEFPFVRNPRVSIRWPLRTLRGRYERGSRGIVIAAGKHNFRYCCHLISCLRKVHRSNLPVQVAYAGDTDLPPSYREFVKSLEPSVETLNVLDTFDDATLDLVHGGWAIKPFAALASKFEQTILADADAVFLQSPKAILNDHSAYREHGALLFHDRLMWKGAYPERHKFWETAIGHHAPSETLTKSKVYMDGYAEEGDSGVVVVNKTHLSHFLGLLHVCWQNMKQVRDAVTYFMGYGDKESWWFGFELSGAPYAFEDHYGAVIGEEKVVNETTKVCGFTIGHVDERDQLLWYNGSLLKNKAVNGTEFMVPEKWMIEGSWEKGRTKADWSCMKEAEVRDVGREVLDVLRASVKTAKDVDRKLTEAIGIDL